MTWYHGSVVTRYPSPGDAMRADVARAIAMATGGALVFAPIEYVLTLWEYSGETELVSKLELVALAATLASFLWLLLVLALVALMLGVRVVRTRIDPAHATAPGLFALQPLTDGVRRGVPLLWAALLGGLIFGFLVQRGAAWATYRFKEPQLTAGVIGILAIAAAVACVPIYRGLVIAATTGAHALAPFRAWNPLGRWRAAGIAVAGVVIAGLIALWHLVPQSRSVLPVRMILSTIVIVAGLGLGARRIAETTPAPRSKRRARILAGSHLVLMVSTLLWFGADPETKYTAHTASPAFRELIELVRVANDLDRDGFGSLLGELDCAPFDSKINPEAHDIPGDHIDQNCDGRDTTLAELVAPKGPFAPVPDAFKKDWNILLLTIDTVRYDHTSFGGYKEKGRDTTPRLAELVAKSTSFTFAQAPSAGTMASIPAIMTSRFFHSGVAFTDEPRPGWPPILLPENLMFAEVMKRGGYYTGAIGSHEWWSDWGLEQGFDEFDNTIGRDPDPFRVVADKVTDHALAFMSRNHKKKWFLWAHYIDPHGRYVAHPDVVDYGREDGDLYDGELRWTDQEVGRLLDEMKRMPIYGNTIVIVTSDHGESMGEHGIPLGTHGTALYRELTHVPLIFFIPDNPPRQIGGPVTPLDILPTAAQLGNIDTSKDRFEGHSLVGALFYGKEDKQRIVFSETNAPNKRRAAISDRYRLIFFLSSNLYELYDRVSDPAELTNLALKPSPALDTMKRALQNWMDRVMYDPDAKFNQAFRGMSDVLLTEPPTVEVASPNQTIEDGKLEILGIGRDLEKPPIPSLATDLFVYFKPNEPTARSYKFQLVAWPVDPGSPLTDPVPVTALRSNFRSTADGAYPTTKWTKGEYIRDRFTLKLPIDWKTDAIAVALVVAPQTSQIQKLRATGAAPSNDAFMFRLGTLPVTR